MDFYNYLIDKIPEAQYNDAVKRKHYLKGEYLYQPSEIPNRVFEVTSGVVKIGSYTQKGEDICYDFIFNREMIGNLRYQNDPFMEFAKAVTDLEVISYDLSLYKNFIIKDALVSEWFYKSIIARRCRMEERLVSVCSLNPNDRILELFQEFNQTITCAKGKKLWVPDLFTDKDIAQLTGLTRQTVSKILKSFCQFEQDAPCKNKKKCIPNFIPSIQ